MKSEEMVTVQVTLEQAELLSVISKRFGYADYRSIADSGEEAYRLAFAMFALRRTLAESGVAVR